MNDDDFFSLSTGATIIKHKSDFARRPATILAPARMPSNQLMSREDRSRDSEGPKDAT